MLVFLLLCISFKIFRKIFLTRCNTILEIYPFGRKFTKIQYPLLTFAKWPLMQNLTAPNPQFTNLCLELSSHMVKHREGKQTGLFWIWAFIMGYSGWTLLNSRYLTRIANLFRTNMIWKIGFRKRNIRTFPKSSLVFLRGENVEKKKNSHTSVDFLQVFFSVFSKYRRR